MNLEEKWHEMWVTLGLKGDANFELEVIRKAYSEAHRAYHNLEHITDCLGEFEPVANKLRYFGGVYVAILYHDFVYDPKASDNEVKSADMAREFFIRTNLRGSSRRVARELILLSTHESAPSSCDYEGRYFTDIDLSILGRPPEEFADYERKIRLEYDFVPEPAFREARSKILRRFLDRPSIYNTDHFIDKYEVQARENLEASIACLKGN